LKKNENRRAKLENDNKTMASTHTVNSALSNVDWIVVRSTADRSIYQDFVFEAQEHGYTVEYMKDATEKELCDETNEVVVEEHPNFDLPFENAFAVAGSHAMRGGLDMVNDLIKRVHECDRVEYRINDIHFDIIDGLSMIVFTIDIARS
jgi:hypothetical protein